MRNLKLKNILWPLVLLILSGNLRAQDLSFNLSVSAPKLSTPMVMKVSVSGSKIAMEPQNMGTQGKMKIILDNATSKQYMLMDANGQKMAMALNMDIEKKAEAVKDPKITTTTETRIIDGYKCTKVITETEEQKADLWITPDVGMQYSDFYKMFNSSKGSAGSVTKRPELKSVKGFPIEIISTDKEKGDIVTLKIRDISKVKVDPKLFSMEGYQVMDAGNMNR
jgi:hypothetical protein